MAAANIEIVTIVSEFFEENCYLVYATEQTTNPPRCVLVDPGADGEAIVAAVEKRGLVPEQILITHGHADHFISLEGLLDHWKDVELSYSVGEKDAGKMTSATRNLSAVVGVPFSCRATKNHLREGDTVEAGGVKMKVLEIPGHSEGHVAFVVQDIKPLVVLVGDVIFDGSIGRTDFPGGNFDLLLEGIRTKLFTLPDTTRLLTGHGKETTVGKEKSTNPYFA